MLDKDLWKLPTTWRPFSIKISGADVRRKCSVSPAGRLFARNAVHPIRPATTRAKPAGLQRYTHYLVAICSFFCCFAIHGQFSCDFSQIKWVRHCFAVVVEQLKGAGYDLRGVQRLREAGNAFIPLTRQQVLPGHRMALQCTNCGDRTHTRCLYCCTSCRVRDLHSILSIIPCSD